MLLRKDGLKTLVQCKQWRSQRVGVQVVREMFGILVSEGAGAGAVKIVALGDYTPDARAFARGKPIELIDGQALLSTVMRAQAMARPDGALDKPLVFAGSVAACLLIAYALPTRQTEQRPVTGYGVPPSVSTTDPHAASAPPIPASPPVALPTKVAAQPARKVYKADAPMSGDELRDWEKRNREAMKILEKTTPALDTPPPR